jgi:outer membrane protein assembly factor BamB
VRGGRPGSEHHGRIFGDYLLEITTDGRPVCEWRSWEHLDPETDVIVNPQDARAEWTHANAVAELPDGNFVVSFRLISTIVVIDRRSGDVIWKLGPPTLNNQHAPSRLDNGNLLVFDNGTHRLDDHLPFSRVLEIDMATKQVVWCYQDSPASNFFSPVISNAQRLLNGNTLICEGWFGRLFEVTAAGEVVWEYVNPYFGPSRHGPSNAVFRAYRYPDVGVGSAKPKQKAP